LDDKSIGAQGVVHPVEGGRPDHRDPVGGRRCDIHGCEGSGLLTFVSPTEVRLLCLDHRPDRVVEFGTGATRSAENLYDPAGFLNPRVLQLYCEYMERHRIQKDGKPRDSDNWQRGMPSSRAYRSLIRHTFDIWLMSRGYKPKSADCGDITDALCAVIFNAMLLLKNWGDGNHHEEGR